MNDNVTLRVNGREWNGWTSVRIGAGIERLARDFSVEITRQWPGDEGITTLQPRIKNGSKVEVLIGDELVITGWVEATPVRYDARSVRGRIYCPLPSDVYQADRAGYGGRLYCAC